MILQNQQAIMRNKSNKSLNTATQKNNINQINRTNRNANQNSLNINEKTPAKFY